MKKAEVIRLVVVIVVAGLVSVFARNVLDTSEQKLLAENQGDLGQDAGFLSKYTQYYQVDEAHANTNFFRWQSGTGTVWVMRTSKTGNVTTWEKSTGTWAGRTNLTYEAIND